jgi:hypothetical protein
MSYPSKPADLRQDTKQFLASEYGKHFTEILREKMAGSLSAASDKSNPNRLNDLDKFSAYKEVIELIESPLDDDIPSRG